MKRKYFRKAMKEYEQILKLDPENSAAKKGCVFNPVKSIGWVHTQNTHACARAHTQTMPHAARCMKLESARERACACARTAHARMQACTYARMHACMHAHT